LIRFSGKKPSDFRLLKKLSVEVWVVFSETMGPYRYHELRPLTGYSPCHWVFPVDFRNCFMSYEEIKDFLSKTCSMCKENIS